MKNKKANDFLVAIVLIVVIGCGILVITNIAKKNKEKGATQSANTTAETNEASEKYVQVLDDGTKLNDSEKLKKNKTMDGIELSNIQLTTKDGITNILCDITNKSNSDFKMQNVYVVLRDEQGNEIYKVPGIIEDIKVGETKQFNTFITADFANAYDFTMIKKED